MAENILSKYLALGQTTISNVLLHHYHDLGMSTSEFMVYLELKSFLDRGQVPNIKQIAGYLGTEIDQVYEFIHELVSHQFLRQTLEKNESGQEAEVYDFSPLENKIATFLMKVQAPQITQQKVTKEELFKKLESGFGRLLSPMEIGLVNNWLDDDHYDPAIIELALRETVLNGKYNFRYMDRILLNWRRRKLTTVQAVETDLKSYAEQRAGSAINSNSTNQMPTPHIPIFKLADQPKGKNQ
ncbi:MAG TPA: DnaD domain protein [Candidatus Limosilactobacillus faecipullorum]|nr:DnaD domain protein [Candidatus Limosilactobacillus faecipullorum]